MLTKKEFIDRVIKTARDHGFTIEKNARNGLEQIDFGHKKLHKSHLGDLFPEILDPDADISKLIEKVAPGRPCTHKPMREIMERIKKYNI
jgi:hypothetical protein